MEWNEFQEQFPSVTEETTTTEEVVETSTEEILSEPEPEEPVTEGLEDEIDEDEIELPDWLQESKPKQDPKVNSSFAEMRRQNKELQKQIEEANKYRALLEDIAIQQNFSSPDQLVDQYYQSKEEQKAQAQGLPIEAYREMQTLRQEMQTLRQDYARQALLHEVTDLASRYNLKLEDPKIANTWRYAVQKNLIDPNTQMMRVSFEDAFKQANFDTFVKEAQEKAVQKYLASRKERQTATPVPHSNVVADANAQVQKQITGADVRKLYESIGLPL